MDPHALHKISYGLYILTTLDNDTPYGCIINTVFQVTSNPARISISCNRDNFTHDKIISSGKFGVTVLSEAVDPELIGLFGYKSGRDIDKFKGLKWEKGSITSSPLLLEYGMTTYECVVEKAVEVGTHTLFIAEVKSAEIVNPNAKEITYAYYHEVLKGRAPKNAPTYIDEAHEEDNSEVWVCSVCGYEYSKFEGVVFKDLPEDYKCPICGADKSLFYKR